MPSDTSNAPPAAGNGGGDAAEQQQETPLYFTLQYIKDLSFENPRAPAIYEEFDEPNVNIHVNVAAQDLAPRTFEVSLKIAVTAKTGDDNAFLAELDYGGVAQVAESVEEQNIRPLILIEGPRLLFPFARSILANLTRDSAFPLLMLGTMDFVQMYKDGMAAQQPGATTV